MSQEPDSSVLQKIQNLMGVFQVDPIRELLGGFHIRDFQESIMVHAVRDPFFPQFTGKEVVSIHIELQTERHLGRDTEVTEPKFSVNEIEIIVETFALVKLKECLPGGLVMPWLINIALFHGGKDVDQPFGLSGFLDDLLNPVIFAESRRIGKTPTFNNNCNEAPWLKGMEDWLCPFGMFWYHYLLAGKIIEK